jgi:hypothetical protein
MIIKSHILLFFNKKIINYLKRKIMANEVSDIDQGLSSGRNSPAIMRTGIVLPNKHPTDPTLYYVAFGDKTANSDGRIDTGVWCTNSLSPFTRYRDAENNPVTYGSYTPIQPYTPVNVLVSNGGRGQSVIIGFPPTNTSTPDVSNVDSLHIVGQTPGGSVIQMDDKTGAIQLIYNKGASVISMADDMLSLEILQGGEGSTKELNTGITLRNGGISLKLRESLLQFDEGGLMVSFNDTGSSMKITRKGVEFQGMETFKIHSDEQVSIKGSKVTIEGTKDASLTASELKVGGKQLTSITGAQINIESIFGTTIKSLAINIWALSKIQEFAAAKDTTILGMITRTAPVIADNGLSYNVVSNSFAVGSSFIGMDANIMTNMGMGTSIARPTYTSAFAANTALHVGHTTLGTAMLLKTSPIAAANKILADTIAGTSEPAQEKTGSAAGARDKDDKKSYGSVAAARFMANNFAMEKYSVVPNLVANTTNIVATANSSSSNSGNFISNSLMPTAGISSNTAGFKFNNKSNASIIKNKIKKF